jgi:hypothetical protein
MVEDRSRPAEPDDEGEMTVLLEARKLCCGEVGEKPVWRPS